MKIPHALTILCIAALLAFGAFAGQASAGGFYGWGSAGCCGDTGYGYGGCAGCGYGGGGYGGYGSGGCGLCALGGNAFWIVGDYDRYIIGHGPMFPAGDNAVGFSYTRPATLDMSPTSTPTTSTPK